MSLLEALLVPALENEAVSKAVTEGVVWGERVGMGVLEPLALAVSVARLLKVPLPDSVRVDVPLE